MLYVIDAYNLIGKIRKISFSDSNKETALMAFMQARGTRARDQFVLVFDGKRDNQPYGAKERHGVFTWIFTPNDQTADEYIDAYLSKQKQRSGLVIVSSDRTVMRSARTYRVDCLRSEEFLRQYTVQTEGQDSVSDKPNATVADVDYWLDQFDST